MFSRVLLPFGHSLRSATSPKGRGEMQQQPRQTLLPGLKLSYDHPHFPGTLRFMRCQSCCQLCQTFCTSSLSSSMSMSLFMLLTSSSPVMVT